MNLNRMNQIMNVKGLNVNFHMMKNIWQYKLVTLNFIFAILKMVLKMIYLLRKYLANILLIKCH